MINTWVHPSAGLLSDDQTNRNASDQQKEHGSTSSCGIWWRWRRVKSNERNGTVSVAWEEQTCVTCGIGRSIKSSSSLWSMTSDACITPSPARLLFSYNHHKDTWPPNNLYNQQTASELCMINTWTHVWRESTVGIWVKSDPIDVKQRPLLYVWISRRVFVLNLPAARSSWSPDVQMLNLLSGVYTAPVSAESCWCHPKHDSWWL